MTKHRNILLFLLLTALLSGCFMHLSAQEEKTKGKLDASADIVSRYIWRGMNLGGSAPSIQPCLEYTYGNFTLGAWGAYSLSHTIKRQEADLYASVNLGKSFNITVTDYFLPFEDTIKNHYFSYKKDQTGHLFEVAAKFLGNKDIPISLMVATNVYGADAKKSNGDNMYSTYVELGYNFNISETSCNAFLGFTPDRPDKDKGETGFYGESPGVVNLGITATKNIKISDSFSLPVSTSLITNPQAENIFLVFGITLQ